MKLHEALKMAIEKHDIDMLSNVVDQLRLKSKMNYNQQFELANKLTGIDQGTWDELLAECDYAPMHFGEQK